MEEQPISSQASSPLPTTARAPPCTQSVPCVATEKEAQPATSSQASSPSLTAAGLPLRACPLPRLQTDLVGSSGPNSIQCNTCHATHQVSNPMSSYVPQCDKFVPKSPSHLHLGSSPLLPPLESSTMSAPPDAVVFAVSSTLTSYMYPLNTAQPKAWPGALGSSRQYHRRMPCQCALRHTQKMNS
jgi:hypothetical protein